MALYRSPIVDYASPKTRRQYRTQRSARVGRCGAGPRASVCTATRSTRRLVAAWPRSVPGHGVVCA
eukprot:1413356-Rhodomonas_salina.1